MEKFQHCNVVAVELLKFWTGTRSSRVRFSLVAKYDKLFQSFWLNTSSAEKSSVYGMKDKLRWNFAFASSYSHLILRLWLGEWEVTWMPVKQRVVKFSTTSSLYKNSILISHFSQIQRKEYCQHLESILELFWIWEVN